MRCASLTCIVHQLACSVVLNLARCIGQVTQLYVRTPNATVPSPAIRLADFARVHIQAGASTTVALRLVPTSHSVVMENLAGWEAKYWEPTIRVEAGAFMLYVGGGQPGLGGGLDGRVTVAHAGSIENCTQS